MVHPDDRERDYKTITRGIEQGKNWNIEHRLVCKDGTEKIVHAIGEARTDRTGKTTQLIGTVQDITKRRQTEELVSRFGRILDQSSNEIYIFHADSFKFILVNEGARNNLGYSNDELQKLTPLDLKPEFTMRNICRNGTAPSKRGEGRYSLYNRT